MTSPSPLSCLTPFDSLLIANRGEIACRIIRTAKQMGIRTIAVYSQADAQALHVKMADETYCIGTALVGESYLCAGKILHAAKTMNAQAIHPGYGFLSENAEFAEQCALQGLVFIGPSPMAIALMGDKAKSKRHMIEANIPCVPGYQGQVQDNETLHAQARKIGLPLMVKAAAGGGGRGMRFVNEWDKFTNALHDARAEALNAFGSDVLILERAIPTPRHVEIQIMADKYGHVIHLGERDCSVQRRHQKVLEESPCPIMTDKLRARMGEAAVQTAKSVDYVGAGTVEFILDAKGAFYFLEMNTRLQVEHPVTEMVTDLDLVALQIQIARGEHLTLHQKDVCLTGHAIEARLYAEDPTQNFLPATGTVHQWHIPQGEGMRVDAGIEQGTEISPFYDPLIAKFIAYAPDRESARYKLWHMLAQTQIFGVKTNKAFLMDALEHPHFANGSATTAFIDTHFTQASLQTPPFDFEHAVMAAIAHYQNAYEMACQASLLATPLAPDWQGWSNTLRIATPYSYKCEGHGETESLQTFSLTALAKNTFAVNVANGHTWQALIKDQTLNAPKNTLKITLAKKDDIEACPVSLYAQFHCISPAKIDIAYKGHTYALTNINAQADTHDIQAGEGQICAPMHGTVLDIFVKKGDNVATGARLAILEAMKMQHEIISDINGIVKNVYVQTKTQIAANIVMIEIEAPKEN